MPRILSRHITPPPDETEGFQRPNPELCSPSVLEANAPLFRVAHGLQPGQGDRLFVSTDLELEEMFSPLENAVRAFVRRLQRLPDGIRPDRLGFSPYTNNIKLYAEDENQLRSLLDIKIQFSRDIGMQLVLEKCRIKTIVRGKHTDKEGYSQNNIRIEGMDSDDVYKYRGILQTTTPAVAIITSKLLGEFEWRLDLVLKTELYGKNKIMAINTFAILLFLQTLSRSQAGSARRDRFRHLAPSNA